MADKIHALCVIATEYFRHEGLPFDNAFLRSADQTAVTTIRKDSIYEINLDGRKMCLLRLPTNKDKRFGLRAILDYIKGEGSAGISYQSKEDSSWVVIGPDSAAGKSLNEEEDIRRVIEELVLPSGSLTEAPRVGRIKIPKPITMPPVVYQVNALDQLFAHWKESTGKTDLTVEELKGMFAAGQSLRDGYDPIFEPLSIEAVIPGLHQLIEDGVVGVQGDKIVLKAEALTT
jgi:hypothetical protein